MKRGSAVAALVAIFVGRGCLIGVGVVAFVAWSALCFFLGVGSGLQ